MKRLMAIPMRLIPLRPAEWMIRWWIKMLRYRQDAAGVLRHLFRIQQQMNYGVDAAAAQYEQGPHPKHRLTRYHDFFVSRMSVDERVADIGCGFGELAFALADRAGANVTALDFDDQKLKTAASRFGHDRIEYIQQDALTWTPDVAYQTLVLSNVLEHIDDRIGFLTRIQASIQPQRWLIRVPRFDRDWTVPMRKELGMPYFLDDTHFIEYTPEIFESEMRDSGLTIVSMELCWGEIWAEVTQRD